jgi:hypothetical protein
MMKNCIRGLNHISVSKKSVWSGSEGASIMIVLKKGRGAMEAVGLD